MTHEIEQSFLIGKTNGVSWLNKEINSIKGIDEKLIKYLKQNTFQMMIAAGQKALSEFNRQNPDNAKYVDELDAKFLKEKDNIMDELNKLFE